MAFRQPMSCILLLFLCNLASGAKYFLPLIKDDNTTQLYTTFLIGTPPVRVNAVVDLANKFCWFACPLMGYNSSSTYSTIPCYHGHDCYGCLDCSDPVPFPTPTCNNKSCGAFAYTPWSPLYASGFISDTISLNSTTSIPNFEFACTNSPGPLKGLSLHTKGLVTLAGTGSSLHAQISSAFNIANKFAICAPSGHTGFPTPIDEVGVGAASSPSSIYGALYFGGGPYLLPPSTVDLSKSLITTALVVNPFSTDLIYVQGDASVEYFINVRSIKIDGTPVRFNSSLLSFDEYGTGGTKISTLVPYTKLNSNIYKPLVDLFVAKVEALNLVKVDPVAPFGVCFSSKSIHYNARTGKGIPLIDLVFSEKSPVLHGKNARWRIYGSNSMVTVSKDVQCLGIVDMGEFDRFSAVASVVIGVKQLEDNLVEFNLENGKLGFTSSLLRLGTRCSKLN